MAEATLELSGQTYGPPERTALQLRDDVAEGNAVAVGAASLALPLRARRSVGGRRAFSAEKIPVEDDEFDDPDDAVCGERGRHDDQGLRRSRSDVPGSNVFGNPDGQG